MDINTKTLPQQSAVIMSFKMDGTKQPVASSFKSVADAIQSADVAVAGEENVTKASGDLKQAVSQLNDHVQNIQRDLQFNIDIESGVIVVKVIDAKSDKVIRQIPTEETIKLAQSLVEKNNHAAFNIFSSKA